MDEPRIVTVQAFDTPVRIRPGFWWAWGSLTALLSGWTARKHPERPLPVNIAVGLLAGAAAVSADVGHAIAHTVSARRVDAPMDEIVLSHSMPRTVYFDDHVTPAQHRMRAMGGPVYSALGLLAASLMRRVTPEGSIPHEIAGWSMLAHGLIFLGSLAPLPFVDGGSIVKWTLVDAGLDEAGADEVMRQVDWSLGVAASAAGLGFLAGRKWSVGLGLLAGGTVAIGAALGKIR